MSVFVGGACSRRNSALGLFALQALRPIGTTPQTALGVDFFLAQVAESDGPLRIEERELEDQQLPAPRHGSYAEVAPPPPPDTSAMAPSTSEFATRYAASFCVGFSAPAAGALVVEESRLLLEGRSAQGHVELSIPYSEVSEVRVGRLPEERLNGNSALLMSRKDGDLVRIEPFGSGLLNELAELIAALASEQADPTEQVSVILPLRRGQLGRARALVSQGPPFDPAVLGLRRHDVFVSDDEAIFVFEGRNVRRNFERLTRDPTLWQAGLAWRNCVGGRPRLSTEVLHPNTLPVFSWTAVGSQA